MAGTTVPDKVALPHMHDLCLAQWRRLRREHQPQQGPPHHYDPKTILLHVLPPTRRCLGLNGVSRYRLTTTPAQLLCHLHRWGGYARKETKSLLTAGPARTDHA